MFSTRPLLRALALTGAAALAVTLATPGPAHVTRGHERLVASHPTNAGKVYRWGLSQWHDGFTEPVRRAWSVSHPGQVDNQHGMLTINGTADSHDVGATYTGHARRYGRWEARVRAKQDSAGNTAYHVVAELIPAGHRKYRCGAQNIELASYRLGASRAHMAIRTLPDVEYTYSKHRNLSAGQFHTYAVEVTKTHISWFVDSHVAMTERRTSARSGAKYAMRFRLVATKGAKMNPGRMQMDWLRYYTLDRPNAKSIKAPRAKRGTYAGGC